MTAFRGLGESNFDFDLYTGPDVFIGGKHKLHT